MNQNMDDIIRSWKEKQETIAEQVICENENDWHEFVDESGYHGQRPLFVGGADISFSLAHESKAVITLTVMRVDKNGEKNLVLSKSRVVEVRNPYVAGFLGFREAPIVNDMLVQLNHDVRSRIDCLLLDGNGILHPQKAGLACHVGVEQSLPTIGVSKSLLRVDGLNELRVREQLGQRDYSRDGMDVQGESGFTWGRAILTGNAIKKPIYVSVGHRVSLRTAAHLVRNLCTFRIPDPIRYADMHSRAWLTGQHVDIFRPELLLDS